MTNPSNEERIRRSQALNRAVDSFRPGDAMDDDIVARAKAFNAFLAGEDE